MLCLVFMLLVYSKLADALSAICYDSPRVNLPIRYFHVQLTDNNQNVTEPVKNVRMTIQDTSCRYRKELIDRFDGSYIARLRFYDNCDNVVVKIVQQDTVLCEKVIENADGSKLLAESCNCPNVEMEYWMSYAECKEEPQIVKDLSRWNSINFSTVIAKVRSSWGHERNSRAFSLCHYAIVDNEIYRTCYGEYVGFSMFMESVLFSLRRKMFLSNMEFVVNLGDYPLEMDKENPVPIFSWCGSDRTADIVIPTYELTNSVVEGMVKYSLDMHTARGPKRVPWNEKLDLPVFRGRDSNDLRLTLARLSNARPDLVDAGITRYFFTDQKERVPEKPSMMFGEFFKYRYVISVDGTVAAYRLPFLLSGDSIILKSSSKFYEHYYSRLIPHVHFVPFDEKNVTKVLEELRNVDPKMILKNVNQFVHDHLQPRDILCYYARAFQEYSKLLVSPPTVPPEGMTKLKDKSAQPCSCKNSKEEL